MFKSFCHIIVNAQYSFVILDLESGVASFLFAISHFTAAYTSLPGTAPLTANARGDVLLPATDAVHNFTNRVELWCHSHAANSSDSAPRSIAAEHKPPDRRTTTLCVFLLLQN